MNLPDTRLSELENPALTRNQRLLLRCRLASEFIHLGHYDTARQALGQLWSGIDRRPDLESLKPPTAAEVLLQCGTLSGWLGTLQHISKAQERAKELLSEALRLFQQQRQHLKVAEARYELSLCSFRLGAHDEARRLLDEALDQLGENQTDLKAQLIIRRALLESWTGRDHDALHILEGAREFFASSSHALQGRWHGQLALVLGKLALREQRADYAERAISEYSAAISHFEQTGQGRDSGINLHRLAVLLYQLGRYVEAHQALDRAQVIFEQLRKTGDETRDLASVHQTRVRVLIAEGHYEEANRLISGVIQSFETGRKHVRLAEALTMQGLIRSRLGLHDSSIRLLRRAISVALAAGTAAAIAAGRAALTLIEEHGRERLSATDVIHLYQRADDLLTETRDAAEMARLRACARIATRRTVGVRLSDRKFVLPEAVQAYEAEFIREALELEEGVVSRAARRLGIRHQTLIQMLKARHQELLGLRTPARSRREGVIRRDSPVKPQKAKDE